MKLSIIVTITLALSAGGCRIAESDPPAVRPPGSGVYLVNEGGFGGGGNLGFYDPGTGTVAGDVVRNAEAWLFPNDAILLDGYLYVALSGSDRIDVIDPGADSVVRKIAFPPGSGPGHLAAQGGRLYCARYDGGVTVVDPTADTIVVTVASAVGFPGDILAAAGSIFVSDFGAWPDTGTVIVAFDPATMRPAASIPAAGGPAAMVFAGGRLYAASGFLPVLWRINPGTMLVEDSCVLPAVPGDLASDGGVLYALTGSTVERIPLETFTPEDPPLVRRGGGLYHYAMGFDPAAGELYVSTVTTAGGSSALGVYDRSGIPLAPASPAGVFTGAFVPYRAPAGGLLPSR